MKHAIIDVGSNSVRINIFADENIIWRHLTTTRLGLGLVDGDCLTKKSIKDTVIAIQEYVKIAKESDASVHIFGTEAIRKAKNSNLLLSEVQEKTGCSIDVISGELEGEIGFIGGSKNSKENGVAVLDIGGASTEIAVMTDCGLYSKSVKIGSVLATFKSKDDKEFAKEITNNALKDFSQTPKINKLYGIGGTITAIAAILSKKPQYDINITDGFVIKREQLKDLCDTLFEMSLEKREQITCISKSRAQTIACGAQILLCVMDKFGIDKITSSESDNLYGYLKKCVLSKEI